jgi:hypothetical protein
MPCQAQTPTVLSGWTYQLRTAATGRFPRLTTARVRQECRTKHTREVRHQALFQTKAYGQVRLLCRAATPPHSKRALGQAKVRCRLAENHCDTL